MATQATAMEGDMSFEGAAVVVVGSGRAIGRACAIEFARCSASVIAGDGVEEENREPCELIAARGGRAQSEVVSDLSDEAEIAAVVARSAELNMPIKGLDHAQTYIDECSIEASTIDSRHRIFNTVAFPPMRWSKGFLPLLKAAAGAAVVHVGSIDGIFGNPGVPAYSAAKG